MNKTEIITSALASSRSYAGYLELIEELHTEEKATSFQDNPAFYNYSLLSFKRMKRVFKTTKLSEEIVAAITAIDKPQTWMLITESWCGDASQTVPIIAKLAELNDLITLKIVLRDSNSDLMQHYLTDGGMSIPILAALDADHNELYRWGPRPAPAQAQIKEYKALPDPKPPYAELSEKIQRWYNADKGVLTQAEILELMVS